MAAGLPSTSTGSGGGATGAVAATGAASAAGAPGARRRLWPAVRRRLVLYGGAYLAFCLCFMLPGCADKLLLFPSTDAIATAARQRPVPFEDGNLDVRVERLRTGASTEPDLYILEFLGNAERAEWGTRLPPLGKAGNRTVEVWRMNYPGYGASDGPARLKRIPPAALAAFDELARVAGGRPIVLHGTSLGCTAALHVAAGRDVAGLILENPPPLQNLILVRHGWWNLWVPALLVAMNVPSELNSLSTAPRVNRPAIFILSEADEVVPIGYQRKVLDAYAGPKQVVIRAGSGHNDPSTAAEDARLQELFDEVILSGPAGKPTPSGGGVSRSAPDRSPAAAAPGDAVSPGR